MCSSAAQHNGSFCLRSDWETCGLGFLDYILPVLLWTLFGILTIAFAWYTRMWQELSQDVKELHNIQTQGSLVFQIIQ